MCRKFFLLALSLFIFQADLFGVQYAYQVNFTNKNGTVLFSDSLSFLTTRAMARRVRQGIALDSTDLPVVQAYIDSTLTLTGGILHEVSHWLNLCVILLPDSTLIHRLDGKSFISSVQLVAYYPSFLHYSPLHNGSPGNNLQAARTTSVDPVYYGSTWVQTLLVKGNYLSDLGYQGAGKIIAIVDAGFLDANTNPGFDSLWANGRVVDMHNFTYDTSYVFGWDEHGMTVLSTMAGYVPDTFVGSAPKASYALYITEDDNSEQPIELINMLCGAERADSIGADIISSSLGYNTFDDPAYNFVYATDLDGKSTIVAKAANLATKKGMLFVTSAGNEGGDSWNYILTPGDADSALTIGSVYSTGVNAANSGYGPNAAGQIKPDVCAMGEGPSVFIGNIYGSEDGTSFSTPQIAGWAACLWEAAPSATPWQIRHAIDECANHYSTPGNQIGYGIPDFSCTATALNILDTPLPGINQFKIIVPNPLTNQLIITLSAPQEETVSFRLFDITGREVMHFSNSFKMGWNTPISYDIASLPKGLYLLKAVSPNGREVMKLVKE